MGSLKLMKVKVTIDFINICCLSILERNAVNPTTAPGNVFSQCYSLTWINDEQSMGHD